MQIIITDVTDMSSGHICVAGWSLDEKRMVRPLRDVYGNPHWSDSMARDDLFSPGNIITVAPSGKPPSRGVPHAAEDFIVSGIPVLSDDFSHSDMVEAVSGSVYDSVQDLFGETFSERKYVPEGQGIRSLGALESNPRTVRFYDSNNRLTCWFIDGDSEKYSFKITCMALKHIYDKDGIEGLNELKIGASTAHIRLGLANPWDGADNAWNPKRCYAMVNGVFFV